MMAGSSVASMVGSSAGLLVEKKVASLVAKMAVSWVGLTALQKADRMVVPKEKNSAGSMVELWAGVKVATSAVWKVDHSADRLALMMVAMSVERME